MYSIFNMDTKREIAKIVRDRVKLPHYKVFLFGSRVKGDADARSDFGIGIEAPEEIPLEAMTEIKSAL